MNIFSHVRAIRIQFKILSRVHLYIGMNDVALVMREAHGQC